MAARADPPPTVEDDPSTASDAVSLHTIAEQADAYEAQEQEDADFALALALEEQESARFARTQRIIHPQSSEPRAASEPEAFTPYRDEPEAVDDIDPPPYRDDPDADPAEGEQTTDAEAAAGLPQRQNIFLRILRKIAKAWLCYLICSTVFTIIVVVAVLVLAFIYGGKQGTSQGDPKEAAWLASGSQDYDLNLPKLYPALEESTSYTCKKTWEDLALGLPCHRMILSPAWDNGNPTEAKAAGTDPVYYNEAVCTRACKTALDKLDSPMPNTCVNRTNRFDFDRYGKDGKAYFEKHGIEEGPADVSKSLLARYDRLCSGPQKRYMGKKPLSCAEDLWMTWGIVDGKHEANLNGLDTFLEQTSVKKTIPASRQTVVKLTRSGKNATFTRSVRSRRVGPGRGETECSDCLRDWLARKTLSFRYGEILKPGTRTPLGLADFAARMKNASQRCYAYNQKEDHVWEAMGWWCDGAPCQKDDYSIPWTVINVLHGHDKTHPPSQLSRSYLGNVPDNKKEAVRTLLAAMKDMRCDALGLTPSDFTNPFVTSAHVLSRLCTPLCLNSVDRIAALVEAAKSAGSPFTLITDSIANVHTLCKSSSPISFTTTPETLCVPGYAALNLTSLIASPQAPFSSSASTPPLPRASILSTFRTALASIKTWNDDFRPGTLRSHGSLQKLRIAESACNTCAGEMFIGKEGRWKETVDAFLADPEVNGTEYVRVAREGWVECGKMFGMRLSRGQRREMFEKVGLGEGVGGLSV
ncbi:hypothetical protein BCR34DRAFT_563404 [Clohesyomyces aquaticus]|uniref:Uncharacterized protein n=1 Tax=Clohesyomyces aquaticus TaxID=1231657 RepID=A0A1Y1ZQW3_9PLEO|nr:hypothetical protein BCR34DRAFT_563404 [Clohesyomyces aquaticus]